MDLFNGAVGVDPQRQKGCAVKTKQRGASSGIEKGHPDRRVGLRFQKRVRQDPRVERHPSMGFPGNYSSPRDLPIGGRSPPGGASAVHGAFDSLSCALTSYFALPSEVLSSPCASVAYDRARARATFWGDQLTPCAALGAHGAPRGDALGCADAVELAEENAPVGKEARSARATSLVSTSLIRPLAPEWRPPMRVKTRSHAEL